ncbi:thermostable hemolysin [Crenobacter intestini]|uniref:Thermostable hemolysin n=1 Tax=Crenobacter intestini TaxID=2563443 RepID=A0A4T0UJD1_9NEIS|nr:thermostable hemolysin [Crenobacter intestini]TIC78668.1 thermostable hemolysin [Crenobacter intestini]
MSALPVCAPSTASRLARRSDVHYPLLSGFVAATFERHYDARPDHFLPWLMGEFDGETPHAVLGLRAAETGALYLEHYLAQPAEQVLAGALGRPVARRELTEIGNLAAHGRHAQGLIRTLVATLAAAGRPYVMFTASARLNRLLTHMGLSTRPLLAADPARLPADQQHRWGRYYDEAPQVTLGLIEPSYARLAGSHANDADWLARALQAQAFARRIKGSTR